MLFDVIIFFRHIWIGSISMRTIKSWRSYIKRLFKVNYARNATVV